MAHASEATTASISSGRERDNLQEEELHPALEETRLNRVFQTDYVALERQLYDVQGSVESDDHNGEYWSVFVQVRDVQGNDVSAQHIEHVKFVLHPTFVPRTIQVEQAPFEVHRIGWGTFRVKIKIQLKERREKLKLYHELDFSKPKTSQCVQHGNLVMEYGNLHLTVPDCILAEEEDTLAELGMEKIQEIVEGRTKRKQMLQRIKDRYDRLMQGWDRITEFLAGIPPERHGMALGAFLAGVYRGNLDLSHLGHLYAFATDNLRYIVLDPSTLEAGWRDFVIHWKDYQRAGDESELERAFTLSQSLPYNQRIDIFVSHCWSDDGGVKADLLQKISQDFELEHGRLPRIWMDMFCMPQIGKEAIERNVEALPLFLKASDTVAVLLSPTLLTRLWCLVEIYTAYILSPQLGHIGFEIYKIQDMTLQDNMIDITTAQCGHQEDQDLLFQNLRDAPGGLRAVEWGVNASLKVADQGRDADTRSAEIVFGDIDFKRTLSEHLLVKRKQMEAESRR